MLEETPSEKIRVRIDAELEDLIPSFLQNRERDVQVIREALDVDDFDTIRVLGHSMKGSGGGYGFDAITDLGRQIEDATKNHDKSTIVDAVGRLEDYLQRLDIEFVW